MGAIYQFNSTDSGAPTLSGEVGKMDNIAALCLSGAAYDGTGNAYGSTPCAGWTRPYSATNIAVLRPPAASKARFYYQFADDGASSNGAKVCSMRGYETMSSATVGTQPFPTVAQETYGLVIAKSDVASSATRAWKIFADDRSALILTQPLTGSGVGYWWVQSIGDGNARLSTDAYMAMILGQPSTDSIQNVGGFCALTRQNNQPSTGWFSAGSPVGYVARNYTGAGGSTEIDLWISSHLMLTTGMYGGLPKLNPADQKVYTCPIIVGEGLASDSTHRGWVRLIHDMPHAVSGWVEGEEFPGSGAHAGKTFRVINPQYSGQTAIMAIQIAGTGV